MKKKLRKLEEFLTCQDDASVTFTYKTKHYYFERGEGDWNLYLLGAKPEWLDDLFVFTSYPYPAITYKKYPTKEELLRDVTLEGRPLLDILTHYEEEYGTEKNPRPPQKFSYERLKAVPIKYPIGSFNIQIANPECVERPEYKVTPHNYYDDPYHIEIEWDNHDEQGNRYYSMTMGKELVPSILYAEDIPEKTMWDFLDHVMFYGQTLEEHCKNQDSNDRVVIRVSS